MDDGTPGTISIPLLGCRDTASSAETMTNSERIDLISREWAEPRCARLS